MMKDRSGKMSHPRQSTQKILVVDDELDVLRSTQMLLDRLGYTTLLLPDAKHIEEIAQKELPTLIIQDVVMPSLDLAATIEALRRNPKTSKIPIVLFSASEDLADKAAELDVDGFLNKPFAEQQLREVLEHLLGPMPETPAPARHAGPSAGPAVSPEQERRASEAQRTAVKAYFHEYRNILTALNNYAQFLLNSPKIEDPEREAAEEINRLLLDLEKKADALRQQLIEFVG